MLVVRHIHCGLILYKLVTRFVHLILKRFLTYGIFLFPSFVSAEFDEVLNNKASYKTEFTKTAPINIAILQDNPPFSFVLPNKNITGLHVDIWKLWSKETGQAITFIPGNYSENIQALKNGKADFHAGLFINDKRSEWAIFSLPIDRISTGLFFHGDSNKTFSIEELVGKKIGVGKDTFQEGYLKKNHPNIQVVTFLDSKETINALLNNEIDAILSEIPFLNDQLSMLGIYGALTQHQTPIFSNTTHALIPKKNNHLLPMINQGINMLPIDKIIKMEHKWLPRYQGYFESLNKSLVSSLSLSEQHWLSQNNQFSIAVDPSGEPLEFIDEDGHHAGMSSDYVAYLSDKLSLKIHLSNNLTWAKAIEKIRRQEIDILPAVAHSLERAKFINFSEPYMSFPNVVATRKDAEYIQNIEDLKGKTLAVVNEYWLQEKFSKEHPYIVMVPVANASEGINLVNNREVFGFIDSLPVISHELQHKDGVDLKIGMYTNYNISISFGIRKGLEPLVPIINKAIKSISDNEKRRITNNWLGYQLNVGTDIFTIIVWIVPIISVLLAIIFFLFRSNHRMRMDIRRLKNN